MREYEHFWHLNIRMYRLLLTRKKTGILPLCRIGKMLMFKSFWQVRPDYELDPNLIRPKRQKRTAEQSSNVKFPDDLALLSNGFTITPGSKYTRTQGEKSCTQSNCDLQKIKIKIEYIFLSGCLDGGRIATDSCVTFVSHSFMGRSTLLFSIGEKIQLVSCVNSGILLISKCDKNVITLFSYLCWTIRIIPQQGLVAMQYKMLAAISQVNEFWV